MDPEQDRPLASCIVAHAADAIIFADVQGVIRVWNAAAAALFGFEASEALGQSLDLIIPENLRRAHWAGFQAAIDSGVTRLGGQATLTRALHKSGKRLYVDLSFAVVGDGAGAVLGSVAIARDATQRYEEERARRQRAAASGNA